MRGRNPGFRAGTRYHEPSVPSQSSRFGKLALAALAVAVILAAVLVGIVLAVLRFGALPLDGETVLGGSCVEAVVDAWGPVAIGSYLIALENGGYALVDSGMDSEARAIRYALRERGAEAREVRFIFVTHAHGDHIGGIPAFPDAALLAMEPDAGAVRRAHSRDVRGLADGNVVEAAGTEVEVFALPGHTKGSAAYLACGVLFLGDSAAAAYDGSVAANRLFSWEPEANEESLAALAHRLATRTDEVRYIAFGHQGPVAGLGPLLEWASDFESERGIRSHGSIQTPASPGRVTSPP